MGYFSLTYIVVKGVSDLKSGAANLVSNWHDRTRWDGLYGIFMSDLIKV